MEERFAGVDVAHAGDDGLVEEFDFDRLPELFRAAAKSGKVESGESGSGPSLLRG
jgi:hypothetical protein